MSDAIGYLGDRVNYLLERIGKLELQLHYVEQSIEQPTYNIDFIRLNQTAKTPTKSRLEDGGWDLYANESVNLEFCVPTLIKTGIAFGHPKSIHGLIWDRSSMGKKGVHVLGGLIDNPYTGEIGVLLINLNKNNPNQSISIGDKITQIVFTQLPITHLIEKEQLQETNRGNLGFGSSGER
jgi:dUTP pyrophosphatase